MKPLEQFLFGHYYGKKPGLAVIAKPNNILIDPSEIIEVNFNEHKLTFLWYDQPRIKSFSVLSLEQMPLSGYPDATWRETKIGDAVIFRGTDQYKSWINDTGPNILQIGKLSGVLPNGNAYITTKNEKSFNTHLCNIVRLPFTETDLVYGFLHDDTITLNKEDWKTRITEVNNNKADWPFVG